MSKGARIGGKIINYARPVIDAAADFIPGGVIIKKGADILSKVAEPTANMLESIGKGGNVVRTLKTGVDEYAKQNPSEKMKRINDAIQRITPENIFGNAVNNNKTSKEEIDDDF